MSALAALLASVFQQPTQQQPVQQANTSTYAPGGSGSGSVDNRFGSVPPILTQNTPDTQPIQAADITVTAKKKPTLDNTAEQAQANQIVNSYPPQGQANLNYGGLPGALGVTGTLGKVLGTIGDAFLTQGGHPIQHLPQAQQQQVGNALVGAETDPRAAAARVAATGTPQSAEIAQRLLEQANQQELTKQLHQQNFAYQQSRINDANQNVFNRQGPTVWGSVQGITDPQKYTQMYQLWDKRAKSIDPNAEAATSYGIPRPEEWQPGSIAGLGTTTGQQQRIAAQERGQDMTQQNSQANNRTKITAAQIYARAHPTQPNMPTMIEEIAKRIDDGSASQSDQQLFQHFASAPKAAAPKPANPSTKPGTTPQFREGAVYTDAHGNQARYVGGKFVDIHH